MDDAHAVRTTRARIGFASRCVTAVAFGGTVPVAAALAAAAVVGRAHELAPSAGLPAVLLAVVAVAAVVRAGAVGLRALERGWIPFLAFLGGLALAAQAVSTAARL